MSTYRRVHTPAGTYFFTVVTHRRQKILCEEHFRTALRAAIHETRARLPFIIDGWVLLPDHLHCIWTMSEGDAAFGKRWGVIKRIVSKQCAESCSGDQVFGGSRLRRRESTVWQRRFWEHRIRDEADYRRHMDYLHYNPVKHRLVNSVNEWPYSTFHRYVQDGVYPLDWGGVVDSQDCADYGEPQG
jgi:putative transposase